MPRHSRVRWRPGNAGRFAVPTTGRRQPAPRQQGHLGLSLLALKADEEHGGEEDVAEATTHFYEPIRYMGKGEEDFEGEVHQHQQDEDNAREGKGTDTRTHEAVESPGEASPLPCDECQQVDSRQKEVENSELDGFRPCFRKECRKGIEEEDHPIDPLRPVKPLAENPLSCG